MAAVDDKPDPNVLFDNVLTDLREAGDEEQAAAMAAYMKDHFSFLGVRSPERKAIQKPVLAAARYFDADDVLALAERCWQIDSRELQYLGCELLRKRAKVLRSSDLPRVRALVAGKAWWDTVDALAAHVVGPMVAADPALVAAMDEWIHDDDMWIARTAILHQLTYKERTDPERLFRYAELRASDTEFFIRKALGWALRTYAAVAPDEVRRFVADHQDVLSGLTKREATKHL